MVSLSMVFGLPMIIRPGLWKHDSPDSGFRPWGTETQLRKAWPNIKASRTSPSYDTFWEYQCGESMEPVAV